MSNMSSVWTKYGKGPSTQPDNAVRRTLDIESRMQCPFPSRRREEESDYALICSTSAKHSHIVLCIVYDGVTSDYVVKDLAKKASLDPLLSPNRSQALLFYKSIPIPTNENLKNTTELLLPEAQDKIYQKVRRAEAIKAFKDNRIDINDEGHFSEQGLNFEIHFGRDFLESLDPSDSPDKFKK